MKKLSLILCAAFAIAACGTIAPENEIQETPITVQDLVFDFAVHYPGETKAVKKGWESGDKVFVFFEGVTTGYVTMTHSGSGWGTPTRRRWQRTSGRGSPRRAAPTRRWPSSCLTMKTRSSEST